MDSITILRTPNEHTDGNWVCPSTGWICTKLNHSEAKSSKRHLTRFSEMYEYFTGLHTQMLANATSMLLDKKKAVA